MRRAGRCAAAGLRAESERHLPVQFVHVVLDVGVTALPSKAPREILRRDGLSVGVLQFWESSKRMARSLGAAGVRRLTGEEALQLQWNHSTLWPRLRLVLPLFCGPAAGLSWLVRLAGRVLLLL